MFSTGLRCVVSHPKFPIGGLRGAPHLLCSRRPICRDFALDGASRTVAIRARNVSRSDQLVTGTTKVLYSSSAVRTGRNASYVVAGPHRG